LDKVFNEKGKNKGFTLVELIVVLVILAILAGILVPALLGYIDRSRAAQCEINKSALVKAAAALYADDYGGKRTIKDDATFDSYLSPRIGSLCENAESAGGTLQFRNVCNQGGIVTLHVSSYTTRPFQITATCSLHDDGEDGQGNSTKTAEQVQRDKLSGEWAGGLSHNQGATANGMTLGKAIASGNGKIDTIKALIANLGVDVEHNIVALKDASSIKVDGAFPLVEALSNEVGKSVSPSYTKILSISADDRGPTANKGDERIVTQYLFYEGKDSNNKATQILYGTRIVRLTFTEKNNLGKYKVSDLDGNPIDDTQGLVGWEKETE